MVETHRHSGAVPGPVRSRLWHRTDAVLRQAVLRGATRPLARNLIVNEYPKSGGSWLSQMIAAATGVPFPRRRFPHARSCVMQCHVLRPAGLRNTVVIWRDGRDVMLSFYHHLVVGHPHLPRALRERTRHTLGIDDPLDVRANLPRFIERMMTRPITPRFAWPAFVAAWHGRPGVVETRYEDLLRDTEGELARVLELRAGRVPDGLAGLVRRHSFEAQSGRARGDARLGAFLRAGIAGGWQDAFSPEAEAVFERHAGDAQRALYP